MKTTTLTSSDQHHIPLFQWGLAGRDKALARGIVHISHGMSEYARRYQRLAEKLTAAGYIVYAHDHRGHGDCIKTTEQGYFADQDGWHKTVNDLDTVVQHIRKKHPDLPIVLLGHSMGSYILQGYLIDHSPGVTGCILSGSNFAPRPLLYLGRAVAWLESLRQGKKGLSPLINQLTFAQYNRRFKPNRTAYDWLSRDPAEVDKYDQDPLCGFLCTNHLWKDLFDGLLKISSPENLTGIGSSLPVLVMGGEEDPVSAPRGQQKLAKALQKAGLKNVTIRLYPDGRHEMFNEINHEQVTGQLIQWIDQCLEQRASQAAPSLDRLTSKT
ncbi:MAG: lysophospholipase [Endozoicomonas sp.]